MNTALALMNSPGSPWLLLTAMVLAVCSAIKVWVRYTWPQDSADRLALKRNRRDKPSRRKPRKQKRGRSTPPNTT